MVAAKRSEEPILGQEVLLCEARSRAWDKVLFGSLGLAVAIYLIALARHLFVSGSYTHLGIAAIAILLVGASVLDVFLFNIKLTTRGVVCRSALGRTRRYGYDDVISFHNAGGKLVIRFRDRSKVSIYWLHADRDKVQEVLSSRLGAEGRAGHP